MFADGYALSDNILRQLRIIERAGNTPKAVKMNSDNYDLLVESFHTKYPEPDANTDKIFGLPIYLDKDYPEPRVE